jgi:uncharacterized protein (TIGR03437 family)
MIRSIAGFEGNSLKRKRGFMTLTTRMTTLNLLKDASARRRLIPIAIAVAAFILPVSALADITNATVTLNVGESLDLDNGTTNTAGTGDITLTATSITYIGKASGANITAAFAGAVAGQAGYTAITDAELVGGASSATNTPILTSSLVAGMASGSVLGIGTNGGNAAKILVLTLSSTSIGIMYTTYGGTASGGGAPPSGGPTVTGVTNNYSFTPPGFTNSGVSPSSIIAIFGTGMAAAVTGPIALNSSAGPNGLPTTQNGTSIAVTVNGTSVTLPIYYATPTQIAAVLPHNTPVGSGTLTVTYNGAAGNAFAIQVVASAFGLDAYYGTGTGPVVMTNNASGSLHNFINSAGAGENVVLWGSGLGADPADSDTVFSTSPQAVNQSEVQVWFGGVQGTVTYAGSSGYPGLNQINVTIPSGVTGCYVSVAVVVGSDVSNFGTAPIGTEGSACTDTLYGSGSTLTTLTGQSTVKNGTVFVGQLTSPGTGGTPTTNNIASANFQSVTGTAYGAGNGGLSIGSCSVTEIFSAGGGTATSTGLDAGTTIGLSGPAGMYTLMGIPMTKGTYEAQLPSTAITSSGGTFVFTGTGGADVGSFTATVNLPNPLLNWTNQSAAATVTLAKGLQVTWTGGATSSYVVIMGSSNGSNGVSGSYTCYAPTSALQFTVPAYVTGVLPAGTGATTVEDATIPAFFTATGLDYGFGLGFSSTMVSSTYQ